MNYYEKTLFNLSGKVAIVTGGAGTLGTQFGITLASAGAIPVIADIDKALCDKTIKRIQDETGELAFSLVLDVCKPESVENAMAEIISRYNRIDILINNAGVSGKFNQKNVAPTFENYPFEEWQKAFDINISGMFLCVQQVIKQMQKQKSGNIVNIGSILGFVSPDQRIYMKDNEPDKKFIKPISYCVSKSAVYNFTRYLATLYAGDNIRVNTLTPGGVDDGSLDDEFKRKYSERAPIGRMAIPTDYNGAILYLCSEASSYVTGTNIIVDGGWTAW